MKKTINLPILGALLLTLPAAAAELRRERVPADVRWVGHLDFAAIQRTTLWSKMVEHESLEFEDALEELDRVRTELGIDPLNDLRSVTVYGRGELGEDAVVVVETTSAIDRALERFAKEDEYRRIEHDGYDIHSWGDGGFAHVVRGVGDERLLVISEDLDLMVEGARVLNGKAPSHASVIEPLETRVRIEPMPNSVAFFACQGFGDLEDLEPVSAIAALAQGLVLDMGESHGELFAHLNVRTKDVDTAINLHSTIVGFVALGRLALIQEEVPDELELLLDAVRAEARGNSVSVEFRYEVEALFDLIDAIANQDW